MIYVDFYAGGKDYKLRLNTRNVVMLEKRIGCNPITIFGTNDNEIVVPTVTTMVEVLNASLQQLNHGITLNEAYDIFDAWLADGHSTTEFSKVIMDIYKVSGLFPSKSDEQDEEAEKN